MAELAAQSCKPGILVVDDEPDLLDELRESLLAAGWEVAAVTSASAACQILDADQNITVVLSDIRMPGMDGLGLAKWVCDRRGDALATQVVLLTGHGTVDDAAKAVRVGAFDFLSKPVSLRSLLDATERAHVSAADKRRRELARLAELDRLNADRDRLECKIAATEAVLINVAGGAKPPE